MATRLIRLTLAMLASLWFAACGGGGGASAPPVDSKSPELVSMTPATGATGVPTDTRMVALYNEAITCSATTIQVGGVSADVSCSGKELTAKPKSELPSGKTISAVLPAPSDLAGNVGVAATFSFTTKAADTTPPKLVAVSIADGSTDVPVPLPTVVYTFDEVVACDKPALTLMSSGHSIAGTATCADQTLSFVPDASSAAFYSADYVLTLPVGAVSDTVGNALATAKVTRFTTTALGIGPRLYTANSNADSKSGNFYASAIDLANDYKVTPIEFEGAKPSYQSFVAVDSATGRVYSTGFQTARGIDVINIATGAWSSFELDPDPHVIEFFGAIALGPDGLYVPFANSSTFPDLANRVFRFDRLSNRRVAQSLPLVSNLNAFLTPTAVIVHPDAARKRVYVLSADAHAMWDTLDLSCETGWYYQPGSVGLVTELHSETLEPVRTFRVGSVPIAAVVDQVGNRLIVVNGGDQSFSVISLETGTVSDPIHPPGFTHCRQPQEGSLLLDAAGRLWVTNTFDGVHVFDQNLVETAFVATGERSVPRGIVAVGDRMFATLWRLDSAIVEITGTIVTRTIPVGFGPYAIGAYLPAP